MNVEVTYRRLFPLVRRHCQRLGGSAHWAEDVAQESFARLLSLRQTLDEPATLAWLYRTSANLCIDRYRQSARRPVASEELVPAVSSDGDSVVELRSMVRRLALTLDPETLQAGLLTRANGLTHVELAEVLGVSERTARRRLADFDGAAQRIHQEDAGHV